MNIQIDFFCNHCCLMKGIVGLIRMKKCIAYHVVTEKPMYIGQHIVFDENHHNGVWQRVNEKLDIVNDVYKNPEKYKNTQLEHHTSVALREVALEKVRVNKFPKYPSRMACLYVSKTLEEAEKWSDYFIRLGRQAFQIVKLKINGNVFYGDAEKCDVLCCKSKRISGCRKFIEKI